MKIILCNDRGNRRFEVSKTHRKVRGQRTDLLHKISLGLVNAFDLIVFEDLKVKNMLKNHHLAKSISDVSWSQLTNFVSYKAEEAGRRVEFVDPKNTSQECSNCGEIVKKSLAQRVHNCPFCGLVIDRDLNASLNILKKGLQKSKGFSICQKSKIFEQLKNVGQELSEFKPRDFSKRRVIQEAPSVRVG